MPERFALCCLGVFDSPIYYYVANRLCPVMLFVIKTSPLFSLNLVYYKHYLFQKTSLYPEILGKIGE